MQRVQVREVHAHELDAADLPLAQQARELRRGGKAQVVHGAGGLDAARAGASPNLWVPRRAQPLTASGAARPGEIGGSEPSAPARLEDVPPRGLQRRDAGARCT
jgi:hypothetical protein